MKSTRYILAGGYTQLAPDCGKAFVEACTEGLSQPIRILFCGFAKSELEWEIKRTAAEQQFSAFADVQCPITMATEEHFLDEIKAHDLVYLNGGDTPLLYKKLCSYSSNPSFWQDVFAGKVIVGNSAGVNVLTALSYNVDRESIQHGLGIVQHCSLVHFKSPSYNAELHLDWDKIVQVLQHASSLPPLFIQEGAFEVINVAS